MCSNQPLPLKLEIGDSLLQIEFIFVQTTDETFVGDEVGEFFELFPVFSETRNDKPKNNVHENLVDHDEENDGPKGLSVIERMVWFKDLPNSKK